MHRSSTTYEPSYQRSRSHHVPTLLYILDPMPFIAIIPILDIPHRRRCGKRSGLALATDRGPALTTRALPAKRIAMCWRRTAQRVRVRHSTCGSRGICDDLGGGVGVLQPAGNAHAGRPRSSPRCASSGSLFRQSQTHPHWPGSSVGDAARPTSPTYWLGHTASHMRYSGRCPSGAAAQVLGTRHAGPLWPSTSRRRVVRRGRGSAPPGFQRAV